MAAFGGIADARTGNLSIRLLCLGDNNDKAAPGQNSAADSQYSGHSENKLGQLSGVYQEENLCFLIRN